MKSKEVFRKDITAVFFFLPLIFEYIAEAIGVAYNSLESVGHLSILRMLFMPLLMLVIGEGVAALAFAVGGFIRHEAIFIISFLLSFVSPIITIVLDFLLAIEGRDFLPSTIIMVVMDVIIMIVSAIMIVLRIRKR